MSFKSFYIGDVSSPVTLQVYPSFDYNEIINSERRIDTTHTGKVRQYKLEGGYFTFSLPLDFVSSSDASIVRDFWRNQTTVRFSIYTDVGSEYVDCRITNNNDPFNRFANTQYDRLNGELNLISVNDQLTNRGIQKS